MGRGASGERAFARFVLALNPDLCAFDKLFSDLDDYICRKKLYGCMNLGMCSAGGNTIESGRVRLKGCKTVKPMLYCPHRVLNPVTKDYFYEGNKKMKKSTRILSIALAAFMLLSLSALTACKDDENNSSPSPSSSPAINMTDDKTANPADAVKNTPTPAPSKNPGSVNAANWGIDPSKTLVTIIYGGTEYTLNSSTIFNLGVSVIGSVPATAGKDCGIYEGAMLKYSLAECGIDLSSFSAGSVTLHFYDGTSKDITSEIADFELMECILAPCKDFVAIDPETGIYFVIGALNGGLKVIAYSNVMKIEIK